MTATCTPGFPSVVSALVSSISLPAFAPVRIWMAASRPPTVAIPWDADIGCEAEVAGGALATAGAGDIGLPGSDIGMPADAGAPAIAGAGWGAAAFGASAGLGVAPGRSTMVFSNSCGAAA